MFKRNGSGKKTLKADPFDSRIWATKCKVRRWPMFKSINKEWKAYQLKRQLQTTNAIYNEKISAAHSEAEASRYHKEKINSIFSLVTHYLKKNKVT